MIAPHQFRQQPNIGFPNGFLRRFLRGFVRRFVQRPAAIAAALAVAAIGVGPAQGAEAETRDYQLQIGIYSTAPWNLEHPFINHAKSFNTQWTARLGGGQKLRTNDLIKRDLYDRDSGLPTGIPMGAKEVSPGAVLSKIGLFPDYYAGEYILEWDGKARAGINGLPQKLQKGKNRNRVVIDVKPNGFSGGSLNFRDIGEGFGNIRLYRREHEDLFNAGEIWNPAFIKHVRAYDIIRTMDMQSINASPIRRFDDIATPDQLWGEGFSTRWPPAPYYSIPYEILFDLGVTADRALWVHIPPQIGAPRHMADPAFRRDDRKDRIKAEKLAINATENFDQIVNSPEWDRFATAFLDRLASSEYPPSRPLYIEVGNEVWNFSPPFIYTSRYAEGVGRGFNKKWKVREGYGVLTARWMLALEKAQKAKKTNYNFIYVVGCHSDWPSRTRRAYRAMEEYFQSVGVDPAPMMAKTGAALTTYIGGKKALAEAMFGKLPKRKLVEAFERAINEDPDELESRLRGYILNRQSDSPGTLGRKLTKWAEHEEIAKRYGSRLIGAYEGGSHLVVPNALKKSPVFMNWWREFHWGEPGADIVRQVNNALLEQHPGIILSNYASIGEIGKGPWIDGHYAARTPMMEMWEEFAIPPAER